MPYKLHILKSTGRLDQFVPEIEDVVNETLSKVEKVLKFNVDIVLSDQPDAVIPETGLGGYSLNKNLLYIYSGPTRENFKEILKKELPRTVAHEIHHCVRWEKVGYGKTLLEAIISEGLAEHFDIEINNNKPTMWASALDKEKLFEMLEKAKVSFDDKNYNHASWFFGADKENIPRWTGYSLGYHIVSDYLKKFNKKASELVGEPAESFIKYLRN